MSIKKTHGTITRVVDLSKTAKEISITLDESLDFIAGNFVNIFMDIDGEKVRRAYSISSSDKVQDSITLSIRASIGGKMSSVFWNKDLTGEKIELMGPLGLNTADKMNAQKIYLFAFGVGAGVVKSLADHFATKESIESIVIVTGSRTSDEIIYKDYFDSLQKENSKIKVSYVISSKEENSPYKIGYIQDHLDGFDFNTCDVYVCGQEVACNGLVEKVKSTNPVDCNFMVEAFH